MSDVALSFGSVFVAEMGDKTQLVVLSVAARVQLARLVAVLVLAIVVLQTVSVTVGAAASALLPVDAVAVAAGLMFIGFGLWTWRSGAAGGGDADQVDGPPRQRSLVAVGLAFFGAELGDKTMLTTAALAADRGAGPVWLGSFAAMVAALGVAVVAGRTLLRRLSPRTVDIVSGTVFVTVGVFTLSALLMG
ncbi:MAG: TMEM165/GDT1 family protein [Actinomycetota bacterium]